MVAVLVTLTVFCGLCYGGYRYLNQRATASVPSIAHSTTEDSSSLFDDGFVEVPLITYTEEKDSNTQKKYSYNLSYPKIALVGHPDLAKETNVIIATFAKDMLSEFQTEQDTKEEDLSQLGFTSVLTMSGSPQLVSPTILSIRFDSRALISSDAPPKDDTRILNYDISAHRILSTDDLFASSTVAIPVLADLSRQILQRRFGDISDHEFSKGAADTLMPTSVNFRAIAISRDGLIVMFKAGQVAPIARGAVEIAIPLSDVRKLLNEGIIRAIALANSNYIEAIPETTQ